MTPIFIAITLLAVMAIFLVVKSHRGVLAALGVSVLALVVLGASYLALAAIIVSGM